MLGSNNYLGLTRHPRVVEAAQDAVAEYGTSMTGSRLLNGTTHLHEELEDRIAEFLGTEAALVFTTGYQANLGVISALVNRRSVAVVDKADHASIYDGCRLADGEMLRFRHNDAQHLDTSSRRIDKASPASSSSTASSAWAATSPTCPGSSRSASATSARLLVDDAHGIGVIGEGGRGTASHFGLEGTVDLIMGTFSKSLASIGGFVAGERAVLEWIKHFARSMLFCASLPPASAAAALTALDVLIDEPELVTERAAQGRDAARRPARHGFRHRRLADADRPGDHRRRGARP